MADDRHNDQTGLLKPLLLKQCDNI